MWPNSKSVLVIAAIVLLALSPTALPAEAVFYSFGLHDNHGANLDGGVAVASDGTLYGVANESVGPALLFKRSPNGSYINLHMFTSGSGDANPGGAEVPANTPLIGSDSAIYGTTFGGGSHGCGAVFKATPAGSYSVLYSFDCNSGANPNGGLIEASNGKLYGTTVNGGNGYGVVFQLSKAGVYTRLYSFGGGPLGAHPNAGLIQGQDGVLYGTTLSGGSPKGNGTVFQISTAGVFSQRYVFPDDGSNGAAPYGRLARNAAGDIYGTCATGGNGNGVVFKLTASGILSRLHTFGVSGFSDGLKPFAGLVFGSDGLLYGAASEGGDRLGLLFSISETGGFAVVHSFGYYGFGLPTANMSIGADGNLYATSSRIVEAMPGDAEFDVVGYASSVLQIKFPQAVAQIFSTGTALSNYPSDSYAGTPSEGAFPLAPLVQGADGNLYGTTSGGGAGSVGTIFKLSLAGQLETIHTFDYVDPYDTGGAWSPGHGALARRDNGALIGALTVGGPNIYEVSGSSFSFLSSGNGLPFDTTFTRGSNGHFYALSQGYMVDADTPNGDQSVNVSGPMTIGEDGYFYVFDGSEHRISVDGEQVTLGSSPVKGEVIAGSDKYFYGYGTGGANSLGGIYRLASSTGSSTLLHSFDSVDGSSPVARLLQARDGNFYGVTGKGGSANKGVVFRLTPQGAYSKLYSFIGVPNGEAPEAPLIQASDGKLYLTTSQGGLFDQGAVLTFDGPAAIPLQLKAVPSGTQATLSWAIAPGAAGYNIYRSDSSGGEFGTAPLASGVTQTNYVAQGLVAGAPSFFKITAVNGVGETQLSSEASINPPPKPAAPIDVTATSQGASQVTLSWTASPSANSYNVYAALSPGAETIIADGIVGTSYVLSKLFKNQTYYFRVSSVGRTGESGLSEEASASLPGAPPTAILSLSNGTLSEHGSTTQALITLSWPGTTTSTYTLKYGGTAKATVDYKYSSGKIVIPANATTGSVVLTTIDNATYGGDKTIVVSVVSGSPTPAPSKVTATVIDDDPAPSASLSISPPSLSEHGGVSTVTATLSQPASSLVTIPLDFSGTAKKNYVASAIKITINPGSTLGSITLTGIDDSLYQGDKTVQVAMSSSTTGANVGTPNTVSAIVVDDEPVPTLSLTANSLTFSENGGTVQLTATLSGPAASSNTVFLQFSGSAKLNVDYKLSASTIKIAAGATSGAITLTGLDDAIHEGPELLGVSIKSATIGTPGGASSASLSIQDDDP